MQKLWFYTMLMAVVILALGLFVNPIFAGFTNTVEGKAEIRLEADVDKDFIKTLPKETIENMRKRGWKRTEKGFAKNFPAIGMQVKIDGEETTVARDGSFVLDVDKPGAKKITLSAGKTKTEKSVDVKSGSLTKVYLRVNMDFHDFLARMDSTDTANMVGEESDFITKKESENVDSTREKIKGNGDFGILSTPIYERGIVVTCNRFNGPDGNQIYYADHTDPQALINFVGSTCEEVLETTSSVCFWDYTAWRYCLSDGTRNCSPLIRRNMRYHPHHYYVGPIGNVNYQAHVQDYGWLNIVDDGYVAGTTGQARRMEAIKIKAPMRNIYYQAHVQNIGWQPAVSNGAVAGTTGLGLRMEAIRIWADRGTVKYWVHVQDRGWMWDPTTMAKLPELPGRALGWKLFA